MTYSANSHFVSREAIRVDGEVQLPRVLNQNRRSTFAAFAASGGRGISLGEPITQGTHCCDDEGSPRVDDISPGSLRSRMQASAGKRKSPGKDTAKRPKRTRQTFEKYVADRREQDRRDEKSEGSVRPKLVPKGSSACSCGFFRFCLDFLFRTGAPAQLRVIDAKKANISADAEFRATSSAAEGRMASPLSREPCHFVCPAGFLETFGGDADAARGSLIAAGHNQEAASLRTTCRTLAQGACDGQGRLLTGSVSLHPSRVLWRLHKTSPVLLQKMSLHSISSPEALNAVAAWKPQFSQLQEVYIQLAPPRVPPRTARDMPDEGSAAASALALALVNAVPPNLRGLEVDLRGGCRLAGDEVLERLGAMVPQHALHRLRLDLNQSQFGVWSAEVVAGMLPHCLKELRLLFHAGRSFVWLGTNTPTTEDKGLHILMASLPKDLENLRLMLECSDMGAVGLTSSLPVSLKELDLSLHLRLRGRPRMVAEHHIPQALASSLPRMHRLQALRLSLVDCFMDLEGVRMLALALPSTLEDLRLDICGREVGNEGVEALTANMPSHMSKLSLCLRGWRFTARGAKALARVFPEDLRQLKLVFSGSPIGAQGTKAIVSALPPKLERLNLSFRLCSITADGERVLQVLARKWAHRSKSWVRVREKLSPISPEQGLEWDLWDD